MRDLNTGQIIALIVLAAIVGYWFGLSKAWRDEEHRSLGRRVGALEGAETKRQYDQALKEGKVPSREL